MWLICINRVRTLVRVTGRLNDSLLSLEVNTFYSGYSNTPEATSCAATHKFLMCCNNTSQAHNPSPSGCLSLSGPLISPVLQWGEVCH